MDNWKVKLFAQAAAGEFIPTPKGRVGYLQVQHDGWCKLLNGNGECNCNPTFKHALFPLPGEIN